MCTHTLFWFYKAHCQNGFNKAIKIGHISAAKNRGEKKEIIVYTPDLL